MGVSTLHHHFRVLTAMSPLQYQKQVRLRAARGRLLTDGLDAASAAFEVGYESASQFNRGVPPFLRPVTDAGYSHASLGRRAADGAGQLPARRDLIALPTDTTSRGEPAHTRVTTNGAAYATSPA